MCHRRETMRPRFVPCCLAILLVSVFLSVSADNTRAESLPQVVGVEEDWELVVGTPDQGSVAPQVTTVISPLDNVDSIYATFQVNHQSVPEFVAGGLQLQIWHNEMAEISRKFPNGSVMNNGGETVRWTQRMALADGALTFEIVGGTSTTWGSFGGQGYLKATVGTGLTSLNSYNPAVSAGNSGVSYAANRVQSLVLRKVRLILATGEVLEDDTGHPVYQHQ